MTAPGPARQARCEHAGRDAGSTVLRRSGPAPSRLGDSAWPRRRRRVCAQPVESQRHVGVICGVASRRLLISLPPPWCPPGLAGAHVLTPHCVPTEGRRGLAPAQSCVRLLVPDGGPVPQGDAAGLAVSLVTCVPSWSHSTRFPDQVALQDPRGVAQAFTPAPLVVLF